MVLSCRSYNMQRKPPQYHVSAFQIKKTPKAEWNRSEHKSGAGLRLCIEHSGFSPTLTVTDKNVSHLLQSSGGPGETTCLIMKESVCVAHHVRSSQLSTYNAQSRPVEPTFGKNTGSSDPKPPRVKHCLSGSYFTKWVLCTYLFKCAYKRRIRSLPPSTHVYSLALGMSAT